MNTTISFMIGDTFIFSREFESELLVEAFPLLTFEFQEMEKRNIKLDLGDLLTDREDLGLLSNYGWFKEFYACLGGSILIPPKNVLVKEVLSFLGWKKPKRRYRPPQTRASEIMF